MQAMAGEIKKGVPAISPEIRDTDLNIWGKVDLENKDKQTSQICQKFFPSSIKLTYHSWNIELNEDFNPILLTRIMKLVESVC